MPEATGIDALCVGEAMVALRSTGRFALGDRLIPAVAGAESNVAIGLARLGHASAWCGVLGSDQSGALVRRTLQAEGVDTTQVRSDSSSFTGLMIREERLPSVMQVDYHRRGSAGSRLSTDDVRSALDALAPRLVHISGVTVAISNEAAAAVSWLAHEAKSRGVLVSLDINHRRLLWSDEQAGEALSDLVPAVDILVGSLDELLLLAPFAPEDNDALAKELLSRGPGEVVIKLGAQGATVVTQDDVHHAPARAVKAVDPIGAGDAFAAGYLSALLDGLEVPARLERGVAMGAFAVASNGDWEGLPTRDELGLLNVTAGEALR